MERILEGLVWTRTLCKGKSIKKHWFYSIRPEKVLKNHWFYSIGPKKCHKTIGFIASVRKSIKNHWFYSIGPKKYEKTIGFIDRATENVEKPLVLQTGQPETLKNHWFYCKTSSGQPGNRVKLPIRGLHLTYSLEKL